MWIDQGLLLQLSTLCFGAAVGTLMRGLWLSRAAERAQDGAFGRSARLRHTYSRKPRSYRTRAAVRGALMTSLGLGILTVSLFIFHPFQVPSVLEIMVLVGLLVLGSLGGLFPLFLGLPALIILGAMGLLVHKGLTEESWARAAPDRQYLGTIVVTETNPDIHTWEVLEVPFLYRLVLGPGYFRTPNTPGRPGNFPWIAPLVLGLPDMGIRSLSLDLGNLGKLPGTKIDVVLEKLTRTSWKVQGP